MVETTFERVLRATLAVTVLLVILALFPLTARPAHDIKVLIYACVGGLLALCCAACALAGIRSLRRPTIFPGILVLFLLLLLAASLRSSHVGNSLMEVCNFAALFLVYLVATQAFRTPGHVHRLMAVLCVGVGVSVIYAFLQRAGMDPFPWETEGLEDPFGEMPGTFGNGNLAAHATILCIIMAAYLCAASRRMLWCAALIPLFLAQLHFANQRGGLVGVAAAAVLVASAKLIHSRTERPSAAIIGSVVCTALVACLGALLVVVLSLYRTGVPLPVSRPILLRYHGYSGAVDMVRAHPFLGVGPGNYRLENQPFWTAFEQEHFAAERKMNFNLHNDPLEIAAEAGLPAGGLYLAFLTVGILFGLHMALSGEDRSRRRLGYAFAAFFCAFMVDGFFGFNLRAPVTALLLFLMAGALDGVWSAGATSGQRKPPMQWAVAGSAALLTLLVILCQTRVFASEILLQRGKGAIYWRAYDEADDILAAGQRLAPWNWEFAYQRGVAALRNNRLPETEGYFQDTRAIHPNSVMTHVMLARASLQRALEGPHNTGDASERDPEVRLEMLASAARSGQRALALCGVLPEADEILGNVAYVRGLALREEGAPAGQVEACWQEACGYFRRAIDHHARNKDAIYIGLAQAQMELEDHVGAQQSSMRAINLNPGNPRAWPVLHRVTLATGRPDLMRGAVMRAAEALREQGESPFPELTALLLVWEGDPTPDAIVRATATLAESVLSEDPTQGRDAAPRQAGWAADLLLEELRLSECSNEEAAVSLCNLAAVYAAAGEWEKADRTYAAAWNGVPSRLRRSCAMGWAHAATQRGEGAEAERILQEATRDLPGDLALHLQYARTLALNGKVAEARLEYMGILGAYSLSPQDRETIEQELESIGAGSRPR